MTDDTTLPQTDETDRSGRAATGAAVLGALAMTSCCILPLVLVSLGVTGVFIGQLTALYAYKWVTFSLAAAALAFGFAGTFAGKQMLDKLPEKIFRTILKIILTLISLRLLYGATSAALS